MHHVLWVIGFWCLSCKILSPFQFDPHDSRDPGSQTAKVAEVAEVADNVVGQKAGGTSVYPRRPLAQNRPFRTARRNRYSMKTLTRAICQTSGSLECHCILRHYHLLLFGYDIPHCILFLS